MSIQSYALRRAAQGLDELTVEQLEDISNYLDSLEEQAYDDRKTIEVLQAKLKIANTRTFRG